MSDASEPPFSGVESVTVNGVEAEVDGGSYTAEGVVLQRGENVLAVVARDKAGNESESSITVYYDPSIETAYGYSYDENGNLEQMVKTIGEQSETTTYEYDYENRLTKVTLPNETTNEFEYDGDLRRVSAKNGVGVRTRFFYDGLNNLKDYAADGETVLASYTQGIGIDKLISRTDTSGTRYYHGDALGSTRLMTDEDEDPAATYTYNAWGKVTDHTGEEDTNKFKFTAREFEDEIGLQYNRARFYDPATGRFITQDPLTKGPDDPTVSYYSGVYSIFHRFIKDYVDSLQPDKTNRYVYCYNNPINLTDPLGLDPEKEKTAEVQDAATSEKKGDTKPDSAGKAESPPQEGQTSGEVKDKHGVEDKPKVASIEERQKARDEYEYADETLKERKTAEERNKEKAWASGRNIDMAERTKLYEQFRRDSSLLGKVYRDKLDILNRTFVIDRTVDAAYTVGGAALGSAINALRIALTARSVPYGATLAVDLARSGALSGPGLSMTKTYATAAGGAVGGFIAKEALPEVVTEPASSATKGGLHGPLNQTDNLICDLESVVRREYDALQTMR